MFDIENFPAFVTACVLLNLTPGQDTLFIVGRTVAEGRRVGVASALGISAGTVVHILAAALGLSAILATSATAFLIVKLIGAAYLIYLGFGLLFARSSNALELEPSSQLPPSEAFKQGVLTNVTNPKVALFFLAFLPQFVAPDGSSRILSMVLLGLTFLTTGTLWCVTLAFIADRVKAVLTPGARAGVWLSRACGTLFIALGLRLATSR